MDRAAHERRTSRRTISILAMIGLVAGMLQILAPGAAGVANTCRAKNVTQGTPVDSNLQRVIKAASRGDKIAVKRVCVGNFKIGKKLILVGKTTTANPRPVLNANGSGHVLRVDAQVKLVNVKLTGGLLTEDGCPIGCGGGIAVNAGTLTLKDTIVRGNTARTGGGIFIASGSTVILSGSSSVSGNSTEWAGSEGNGVGGGIMSWGSLTLNDSSSVIGNRGGGGGGIYTSEATLTLNDSSTITGNVSNGDGGGIFLSSGTTTMNDASSVTGNTADNDDFSGGSGGGVYVYPCGGAVLVGGVDGGNVNDNFRGLDAPVEDNIAAPACG